MVNRLIPIVAVTSLVAATCLSMNVNAAQRPNAALNDMGKLSSKGSKAFEDIERARIAIFSGRPAQATKLVKEAQDSLKIAQKDNTSFLKAESDLKPPPSRTYASTAPKVTTAVSWLPVGTDITVSDDFSTPSKTSAVTSANAHLKKGQPEAAMKVLKLANVGVSYTMEIVPLKQTTEDVDKAAGLLSLGKYYEADQVLKQVQDSVRYDWLDFSAMPHPNQVATSGTDSKAASSAVAK
jgi:hypothetical protein